MNGSLTPARTSTMTAPRPHQISGVGRPVQRAGARQLVAGACLLAAALLYVVAVHSLPGQVWDQAAMLRTASALGGSEWTDELLDAVSPTTLALGTVVATVVAFGSYGAAAAVRCAGSVAATVLASQAAKASLPRPQWLGDAANSLPSGHVAAVAAVVVALTHAAPPALRLLAAAVGVVAVGLAGIATVAEQWHRPSDVLASALLAVAVGTICWGAAATPHAGYRRAPRSRP